MPASDAGILAECQRLYHRYVEPATNILIPDGAFCDLQRWLFLEYLAQNCGIVFVGSNQSEMTQMAPDILARNMQGWNKPRLFAFSECITPIFQAILDRSSAAMLRHPFQTVIATKGLDDGGSKRPRYYFGVDYRALSAAPWRRGTIYLYSRTDLPFDFNGVRYSRRLSARAILPLARLSVTPSDWPMLDRVHGFDLHAQNERQRETYDGYPWPDDDEIHPARYKRSLSEPIRAWLDQNFVESISLMELGKEFGMSSFSLLRNFRAAYGVSPREYQCLVRISHAKQLLKKGVSIAQVSAETGFCDQTHMNRHFQRIVGLTPGRYLRMQ